MIRYSLIFYLLVFTGCAAKEIKPGAERIIVSRQAVSKNCKFKGQVIGEQGVAMTGGWNSNKNLAEGAMNELRNKALDLGANYVLPEDSRAGQTLSGSGNSRFFAASSEQTDVTHVGNAYKCPPDEIGL